MGLIGNIIFIILIGVLCCFAFVIAVGAPFLPTLKQHVPEALDLIDLKPGQTLLELGSGDGRILLAAAKRGIKSTGYELNPLLVLYSWLLTYRYRDMVTVVWGNYWKKKWPRSDGIFVFLLDPYMEKLDKKLIQEYAFNGKLVSFAFKIPGRVISKEQNGLFLYKYKK